MTPLYLARDTYVLQWPLWWANLTYLRFCLQVYDHDWGLNDDFLGQAKINLSSLPLDQWVRALSPRFMSGWPLTYAGGGSRLVLSMIHHTTVLHRSGIHIYRTVYLQLDFQYARFRKLASATIVGCASIMFTFALFRFACLQNTTVIELLSDRWLLNE